MRPVRSGSGRLSGLARQSAGIAAKGRAGLTGKSGAGPAPGRTFTTVARHRRSPPHDHSGTTLRPAVQRRRLRLAARRPTKRLASYLLASQRGKGFVVPPSGPVDLFPKTEEKANSEIRKPRILHIFPVFLCSRLKNHTLYSNISTGPSGGWSKGTGEDEGERFGSVVCSLFRSRGLELTSYAAMP